MLLRALGGLLVTIFAASAAWAAVCPGNPDALGTSRVLVVDPTEHARLGSMQYPETLPLADGEVVLTFDDGPIPPYSSKVLETLAAECVRATYFMVGRMARQFPDMVRRIHAAGHTVGTHSQNHPFTFHKMTQEKAREEIEQGIASVEAALGDAGQVAPFFRIPGLLRADPVERYLASRALMTWSADFPADDWKHINASEVTRRALERLEARRKGVLLLHDIQPATAIALPGLLRELKARGYRIVHVVPATAERPKTATLPAQWLARPRHAASGRWPAPASYGAAFDPPALSAPSPQSFGIRLVRAGAAIEMPTELGRMRRRVSVHPIWRVFPVMPARQSSAATAVLPAPSPASFGLGDLMRPERRTSVLERATTAHAETTGSIKIWPGVRTNVPKTAFP